jgi:EmrB/QacA subfamily drug resistance transporter
MKLNSTQRNALLVATLSSFLTPFMGSSVIVSLPSIGHDLSMDVISLGWVSTAYLLAAASFLVPFGKISDIYGRKKVFIWGIVIDNLASLGGALSTSGTTLIVARVLQGIGGAMIFSMGITIITSVFPPEQRGRALGINIAGVYIGLSSGPFIGGFLTGRFGWRGVFVSNILIGMAILLMTLLKLKGEWTGAKGERFDYRGSLFYVASLACLMYGFSLIPAFPAFFLIAAGIAGLVWFVRWETKVKNPVLEMELFRHNRMFLFSNLAALISYSATFAVTFIMSLYLQSVRGFSPEMAGVIMVSQPAMQAVFSPLSGRLSDRIPARIVASFGMVLTVMGLFFFVFIAPRTNLVYVILNLMILGLGFAFFSSPNTNAIMGSVDKRYFGVASGTLATMRLTGQMFSMGIVMMSLALFHVAGKMITPDYYATFLKSARTAFVVFAVLCSAGVLASLARGRVR